ncbi:MAG: RNA methyltransferase [Fimbriimonadaceae bacterium]|nr:RNA methyltransferase [Fimbriimonadaceae bacterium]
MQTVLHEPAADAAVLTLAASCGARLVPLEAGLLAGIVQTVTPGPLAAIVRSPAQSTPAALPDRLLVLAEVRDPGNVGTLLRTADAAGAGLVLAGGCADPLSPKVVRASAGAVVRVPWWCAKAPDVVDWLQRDGRAVLVLAAGGPSLYGAALPPTLALVVGNEGHGAGPEWAVWPTRCLPMAAGAESLNAAVAGSLALYELVRQHGLPAGSDGD